MGGGGSTSSTNSSGSQSSNTQYKDTTTTNPYITSSTTNKGTTTTFEPNSSFQAIYDFTNQNIKNLLNDYVNPSIDNNVNQAKMEYYQKQLGENTRKDLENNIIAPLQQRNMIRSSQATDMYNNLAKNNASNTSDFVSSLIADNQTNQADIINNLMNLVLQGYNVVQGNQAQSLNTSSGNASKNSTSTGNSNSQSFGWSVGL